MTLPASFSLSMSQVATELGLSLPLSLNHAWVEALAEKSVLPVSFSDLLGKTGRYDGSLATVDEGGHPDILQINFGSVPFFDIHIQYAQYEFNGGWIISLNFDAQGTYWAGKNILFKNNTTGASQILSPIGSSNPSLWQATSAASNLIRAGQTDNFTILPST